jgi:hypothetical protein
LGAHIQYAYYCSIHIFIISPDSNESIASLIPQRHGLLLNSTKVMKINTIPDTAAVWANRLINQDPEEKLALHKLLLTIKSEALSCYESGDLIKYADYLEEMIKFYRLPHLNTAAEKFSGQ